MSNVDSRREIRPVMETLESRILRSITPSLSGRHNFPTHTVLTVTAGTLGQPITFDVTVFAAEPAIGPVNLYYRGKLFQQLGVTPSHDSRFGATEATYTAPAGTVAAQMFGLGPHAMRARFVGSGFSEVALFYPSTAVAVFRVTRLDFSRPPEVATATLNPGSGPALGAGQTATVQYTAYSAATYRAFYSTETKTPDTFSFTVDANPGAGSSRLRSGRDRHAGRRDPHDLRSLSAGARQAGLATERPATGESGVLGDVGVNLVVPAYGGR